MLAISSFPLTASAAELVSYGVTPVLQAVVGASIQFNESSPPYGDYLQEDPFGVAAGNFEFNHYIGNSVEGGYGAIGQSHTGLWYEATFLPNSVRARASGHTFPISQPGWDGDVLLPTLVVTISTGSLNYVFTPSEDMYYDIVATTYNTNILNLFPDEGTVSFKEVGGADIITLDGGLPSAEVPDPNYAASSGVLYAGHYYQLQANGLVTTSFAQFGGSYYGGWGWSIDLIVSNDPIVRPVDTDIDGVPDSDDAYPDISLGGRKDTDHDGIPNDCDTYCISLGMLADDDDDGDGHLDTADNCPLVVNDDQADSNNDGVGDACDSDNDSVRNDTDNCPLVANTNQADNNKDGIGNACDTDSDGVLNDVDNCVWFANPDQLDADDNGRGDVCNDTPPGC